MLLKSVCLRQQKQWLSPYFAALFAKLQLAFTNVAYFGALSVPGLYHGISVGLGNCIFPSSLMLACGMGRHGKFLVILSVTCG